MADPLSQLRQYNIGGKNIVENDKQIIFGDCAWPRDVKTNYLTYRAKKEGSNKEYYSLECLLYFLQTLHLHHVDYVHKAAAANVPAVGRPDRKALLSYLNGDSDASPSIDKYAPLPVSIKVENK